jgi:penicillin-binding protein-related factor A (putative recombinase)
MELREKKAWKNFLDSADSSKLKFKRIENIIGDGMSDVIGMNRRGSVFWLENKALESWPARSTTLPLKGVFEPGQIPFMREWCQWGGNAFVLLRVGFEKDNEFYLISPNPYDPRDMDKEAILNLSIIGKVSIRKYLEEL